MLRSQAEYGAIRAFFIESGETPPDRPTLSRHSIKCLGLPPRRPGAKSSDGPLIEDLPPLSEISREALRLFYTRLKNSPDKVATRDLLPFLNAALKEMTQAMDNSELNEALAQLNAEPD